MHSEPTPNSCDLKWFLTSSKTWLRNILKHSSPLQFPTYFHFIDSCSQWRVGQEYILLKNWRGCYIAEWQFLGIELSGQILVKAKYSNFLLSFTPLRLSIFFILFFKIAKLFNAPNDFYSNDPFNYIPFYLSQLSGLFDPFQPLIPRKVSEGQRRNSWVLFWCLDTAWTEEVKGRNFTGNIKLFRALLLWVISSTFNSQYEPRISARVCELWFLSLPQDCLINIRWILAAFSPSSA